MNNIEIFKEISGLVFAEAYGNFPLKISICPSELALKLGDEFWQESQQEISENDFQYVRNRSPAALAKPTIEWLAESGFLTCEQYQDGKFIGVRLTAKGLESIESEPTRGQRLLDAATDVAKDELRSQARQQLSKAFAESLSWGVANATSIFGSLPNLG